MPLLVNLRHLEKDDLKLKGELPVCIGSSNGATPAGPEVLENVMAMGASLR